MFAAFSFSSPAVSTLALSKTNTRSQSSAPKVRFTLLYEKEREGGGGRDEGGHLTIRTIR